MNCPECGAKIEAGHRYCTDCGYEMTMKEYESIRKKKSAPKKAIAVIALVVILIAGSIVGIVSFKKSGSGAGSEDRTILDAQSEIRNENAPVSSAVDPQVQRPVSRETAVPTDVPTAPPTVAPTAVRTAAAPAQRRLSFGTDSYISTDNQLAALIGEMLDYGYDKVQVANVTVSDLGKAINAYSSVDSIMVNGNTIQIEWHPGVRISHAHKNGKTYLLSDAEKQIYQKATEILQNILSPGMSDLEKEIAIHDYIVENCEYEINQAKKTESLYGFFNYQRCQCSGYVDTFYLLGTLAGLEVRSISGVVLDGNVSHAWNLIKLDGMWYAVDVTYDDPIGGDEHHAYLNVPINFFEGTRTWSELAVPEDMRAQILDEKWYYYNIPSASTFADAVNKTKDALLRNNEMIIRLENPTIEPSAVSSELVTALRCSMSWRSIMDEHGIKIVIYTKR